MKLLAAVAVAAIVAAFAAVASASAWHGYPKLNATASWLAQKPVTVRCQTPWETAHDRLTGFWGAIAYVPVVTDPWTNQWLRPKKYSVFSNGICETLNELMWSGWYPEYESVLAVLVIVHESGHMRGTTFPLWKDEGNVNCWAARRAAAVAQLKFNLNPTYVEEFNRVLRMVVGKQPKEYRPSACALP